MRCTKPKTVGFHDDGKTICWSPRKYSKQYATFQLPCGKCISCRLEYARQWAVRCVHEAQMHEKNSFLTLTYDDQHLKSPKLIYEDFQLFMKKLRHEQEEPIGFFVTGEYGDKNKRPHWHAILFNYGPPDQTYLRSNERGDKIFSSELLSKLWGHGMLEIGSVTFESAGYCARYSAKKLGHGRDQDHEFHPISKKSSKNAIGKKFLEKYWRDIYNAGFIVLPNGKQCSIPRYYDKWMIKNHPDEYEKYLFRVKSYNIERSSAKNDIEKQNEYIINMTRKNPIPQVTRDEAREKILEQKFQQLQKHLKL